MPGLGQHYSTIEVSRGLVGQTWNFTSKLLKCLALRLGDEERGEDTTKHEEGEDLQHVVEPWRAIIFSSATGAERTDETLCDDGADLSGGGGDTVARGAVSCREAFARDDECGGIRPEVEKELSEDEAGKQATGADRVVAESHDTEEDG